MKLNILCSVFISIALSSCGGKSEKGKAQSPDSDKGAATTTLTKAQMAAMDIQLGNIEYKNLDALIKVNGEVRVTNSSKAVATTLFGGVVKILHVEVGDYVRQGQVLATIVNPQFLNLQEEYLTVGAKVILAEQELQRQKLLNDANAGVLKNLQNATAELRTLRTRSASLEQQIELLGISPKEVSNTNLKSTSQITSPISGTISRIFAKTGSYIEASFSIVEVINTESLHLDLQIFEKDLDKMKVGQTIRFTPTNNPVKEYSASIFNVGASFENEAKAVAVHCHVKGDKQGLIDKMDITAHVLINDGPEPVVPTEAVVENDGKTYIFVKVGKKHAKKDNSASNLSVADGTSSEDVDFEKVEITKGGTNAGYTAITPVKKISNSAEVVVKGAFFINAKLNNPEAEEE